MHPYRLTTSYKTLILILYQVILLRETQQISLTKRSLDDLTTPKATQDVHHLSQGASLASTSQQYDPAATHIGSPFIVLMSDDTVSVAQLPMILYGNLTDVYRLSESDLRIQDVDLSERDSDHYGRDDAGSNLEVEDSRDERKRTISAQHAGIGGPFADAREYEQMPQMTSASTNTTSASLGKSEWQQIAVGRDREEVLLRPEGAAAATDRKNARDETASKTGFDEPKEAEEGTRQLLDRPRREEKNEREGGTRRRRRRSNSLSDYDDDSSGSLGGTSARKAQEENHTTGDAHTPRREGRSASVGESTQNVTSAQSSTGQQRQTQFNQGEPNLEMPEQQQQPRGGGSPGAPAEDADKTGRFPYPSASSPQPGPAAPTFSSSASSRVHFSDFDVHMALGYAFVADSAGRIHRFKLPGGGQSGGGGASSWSSRDDIRARTALGLSASLSGENENDDDATNTIEAAGSKFDGGVNGPAGIRRNHQRGGGNSSSAHESVPSDANHDGGSGSGGGSGDDDGYTNRIRERTENSPGSTKTTGGVQFENERQHPTISGGAGEQSGPSNSAGPPVSGPNQQQHGNLAGGKQRIIWSRGRFMRGGAPHAEIVGGASSAKHREQQLASSGGASRSRLTATVNDGNNQVVGSTGSDEARTTTSGDFSAPGNEPQQHSTSGCTSVGGGASSERGARQSLLRTQVAVDWLNNLLFVLDKCRLLVMDLNGNNELVLIDDFNANNRPIDIKVDPVNDFLFWLQVGKFHNTIYKLDLSVLSMPSATQKLVSNALRLRQSARSLTNESALNFDASDLVPLVSRHYAHPIITNLPKHTQIFTIDHNRSRIYVPLSPAQHVTTDTDSSVKIENHTITTTRREEAEVFAPSSDSLTHMNSTSLDLDDGANCTRTQGDAGELPNEGQILAYNLDGTDVGPLRTGGERSHLDSFEDIQDLTLDSESLLLYWLTNNGRDLFEEFRENSTIQPAQHYLNGKSYSKLLFFDNHNSNQPTSKGPRFNVRKIIHMLSSSISSNRPTRSEGNLDAFADEESSAFSLRVRNSEVDMGKFSRNAPYIILGVTCLIVITVYLTYALIFQRIQSSDEGDECRRRGHADGSVSGGSSLGSESHMDNNSNGFVNSTTISRWVAGGAPGSGASPTAEPDASTFNRNTNSFTEYDLESSTNYEASNAIAEHYRENADNQDELYNSCLANLSGWPAGLNDLSTNKLYVPVELEQDKELSAIRRVSKEQLEVENRTAPLGEGHFAIVLQGTIKCSANEKDYLLKRPQMLMPTCPLSPDSLAPPSSRIFAPSTGSSGHGSSSSTSCEFATANTLTDPLSNDDYLTPRTHDNSASSMYSGQVMASSSSRHASYVGYCDTLRSVDQQPMPSSSAVEATKLRVAIKKLRKNASPDEKRDFLQEAKLLANFDHPNIVHLIGICLDRGSTMIVMELMLGGDLIRYMRENIPRSTNNFADHLTYDDLLKICLDIANGCCYLEDLDYIHRDLAARNCLVSSRKREERVVKLADFGLARDIYKDSYYKKQGDSAMPLKWMAPECLSEQKFSKKSDVWSFGVVMWEVMSYCQEKPYADLPEIWILKDHLINGRRLRKPDGCDENMYKLMNKCWQLQPQDRPTFHECRSMLMELSNRTEV